MQANQHKNMASLFGSEKEKKVVDLPDLQANQGGPTPVDITLDRISSNFERLRKELSL